MKLPDRCIRQRLAEVLDTREHEIPHARQFEGTGAPALYLERLLGLKTPTWTRRMQGSGK